MKRIVLLGVATLLCATALIAIVILLVGRFHHTENQVLGTTLLLGGYGVLALPGVFLLDRNRLRPLAIAAVAVAAAAAALALVSIWGSSGDAVGKSVGTATFLGLAGAQVCGLEVWATRDTVLVRRLFLASCASAAVLAALVIALLWAQPDNAFWSRLAGVFAVLDVLLVALQPVLARAHGRPPARSLHA